MTSSILKIPLEEAEPVFELARGGRISQDQLTELGVEPVLARQVIDEERKDGVGDLFGTSAESWEGSAVVPFSIISRVVIARITPAAASGTGGSTSTAHGCATAAWGGVAWEHGGRVEGCGHAVPIGGKGSVRGKRRVREGVPCLGVDTGRLGLGGEPGQGSNGLGSRSRGQA